MILDIAAAILVVLGILGIVLVGLTIAGHEYETFGDPAVGWVIALIGVALGLAVVAHRALGWL
jgi:hypothetical protein